MSGFILKKFIIIKELKKKVLPHLKTVTEGRERAAEFVADVGDDLNPMNEETHDTARKEGNHEDGEFAIINPESSHIISDGVETTGDRTYN